MNWSWSNKLLGLKKWAISYKTTYTKLPRLNNKRGLKQHRKLYCWRSPPPLQCPQTHKPLKSMLTTPHYVSLLLFFNVFGGHGGWELKCINILLPNGVCTYVTKFWDHCQKEWLRCEGMRHNGSFTNVYTTHEGLLELRYCLVRTLNLTKDTLLEELRIKVLNFSSMIFSLS